MENEVMLKRIRQIQRIVPENICTPVTDAEGVLVMVERAAVAETTLDIMDTMLSNLARDITGDLVEMEENRRRWAEEDARKKAEAEHEAIKKELEAKVEEIQNA